MSFVFVLDHNKQPCDPIHPALARRLLKEGQAAVLRRYPFTIILKGKPLDQVPASLRLKIDPGSKTTGLALVDEQAGRVVWACELAHRGQQIRDRLLARRAIRRGRRQRHTRYRQPRFLNRRRRDGWLPPSLESRVANVLTWVARVRRLACVSALSVELVRFDTQLLENAEIAGVLYQQGELAGYEVREYLLEKWGRMCAYCGAEGLPLQIEHLIPRTRGGSDRVSNLALACEGCNQRKGNQTAAEFGFPQLMAQARQPLKDAAAVNATRWALYGQLVVTGLPVEAGTGGRTKYNRTRQGLEKAHWLDAACVGPSTPPTLGVKGIRPLEVKATGQGSRQMCRTDTYGFPKRHKPRARSFQGWKTGDLVRAVVPRGKYAGVYLGRIAIRFRPSFRLGRLDVHPKYLTRLHRADGYDYRAGGTPNGEDGHSPAS
jgi:5-methylcytosine-specific restriction endonuclease McrA